MRACFCMAATVLSLAAEGCFAEQKKDVAMFDLVRGGRPAAKMRWVASTNAATAKAVAADVELFNRYLFEVAGASLSTNGEAANVVRIDIKPIVDLDGRFEWSIRFPSPHELVVEATTTSLFTALRQLLEEGCDARFLGVENCMFQYEPRSNVAVAVRGSKSHQHAYTLLRNVYYLPGHARELGLSDDGLFQYSHGIPICAFPQDRYNADGWPVEIMPLQKGKRLERPGNAFNGWQPCYANPATAAMATTNILAYLRSHTGVKSITLGVNDNGGYCECDLCKAADAGAEKSIFSNDSSNHSSSYYRFVNSVAEKIAAEFPDVKIGLLAYTGTIMPPPFKVRPNVVPMMTFDTLAAGMDPAVRAKQDDVIRRWGEKVPETGIWDYCWGRGYELPRVDFAGRAARIKYLYACGGRAYFGENSMFADTLDGPKTYLTARLLENVDANADAILDEWFNRFAGAAASGELRELYRECEDYWRSDEMKRSAMYSARTWIYLYPARNHLFAVKPGFTEGLVAKVRKVLELARTNGERRRAEILLRHFERLDFIVSFKGIAYGSLSSGELASAADAVAMLENVLTRLEVLLDEWRNASEYFKNADFPDSDAYVRRRLVSALEPPALLAELLGKAAGFMDDVRVHDAMAALASDARLPDASRRIAKMLMKGGENRFSNAGFAHPVDTARFKSSSEYEVVAGKDGNELKMRPSIAKGVANEDDPVLAGVPTVTFTEDLEPGYWLVAADVESSRGGTSAEFVVWEQVGGANIQWEGPAWTQLSGKKSHSFARVVEINDTMDGVNLIVRFRGFGKGDTATIRDVRFVRVADGGPSKRTGEFDAKAITARAGSARATVYGEPAIVCHDGYAFAHVVLNVPRIKAGEKLVFTLRTALPEGAKTGQVGAMLYNGPVGNWKPFKTMLWSHRPRAGRFGDVTFSVEGGEKGVVSGKYLVILFKMNNTDSVAASSLSWRVSKN